VDKPIRLIGPALAFFVCFATGAGLSMLFGLESRVWVPAGLAVSSVVAFVASRGFRHRTVNSRSQG
jgi:hypothetical protein